MASYVNDLRLKEIGTGESSGTWGTETNTNLELIGDALGFGTEAITTNADTHTTTVADGSADAGRAMYIKYTGTLDSACTITIGPNTINRMHFIENATTGSQNIIISQGTGSNVTIPAGDVKAVYLDGAGSGAAVADAFASLNVVDLKVQDDFTVTDDMTVGGTLGVTGILTCSDDIIIGDGKTIGSASDVDAMTIASNGQVTFSQTLIGTALDISGDIDVDGTANLDVVDIDGAVDMASTLAVGGALTVTQSTAATAATFKVDNGSAQVANVVISNNADTGLNLGVFGASAGTAGMISASDAFITTSTTELNVGINNSAGIIKFGVGNGSSTASEAMRVHSNARVAISTTAPNANLHVGSSNATGDATNPAIQIGGTSTYRGAMYTTAEGFILDNNNGDDGISFFTKTNGEMMRLQADGVAHITSAGAPIAPTIKHGGSTGDVSKLRLINRSGQGADKGGALELGGVTDDGVSRSDVFGSVAGLKTNATSANREGFLQFSTSSGSALSERIRVDSAGRVSIGTTTTDRELKVQKSGDSCVISIVSGTSNLSGIVMGDTDDDDIGHILYNNSNNSMSFRTNTSDAVTIDSAGSVGVGTASPGGSTSCLHVVHDATEGTPSFPDGEVIIAQRNFNSSQGCHVGIIAGTASESAINFGDKDDSDIGAITYNHSGNRMSFTTNTSETMRLTSAGKLFLGTTSAVRGSEDLSIQASSDAIVTRTASAGLIVRKTSFTNGFLCLFENDSATQVGAITSGGSSTVFNTSSDYRLKENIEPMQNGLERLNQLNPVKFTWKETGEESEGFIAHEVDEIFSDCIHGEKDGENMQGMDYGRITPLLVKAIQEQQEQIDALQSEINNLKGE